ncbi:hypothetical protein ACIHAA_30610 [Streptomyces sp. NPDC052040]|uniref:hypothetical protein n=1 Tax=unclassified Streptomyces TaxID=2593676 RepID=UPI0037D11DA2
MATVITSAALSPADGTGSSIAHAAAAGLACLERAALTPADVDVLINVGVYRDSNIVEPSIAALVQKRIGINLDYLHSPGQQAAFSFDLMNGACGTLNAVQAADALLSTGTARRVLVVSADTHPSMDPSRANTDAFPYASTGAALLLEHTGDADGFGRLHHRSSRSGGFGVNGYLPVAEVGSEGRSTVCVDRDSDAVERMLDLAVDTVDAVVARERAAAAPGADVGHDCGMELDRVLLVTSQPSPGFPAQLAKRLCLASDAAVTAEGIHGDPHTSALVHGYCQAQDAGRLRHYDAILFVAVGAGPASAASLYRLTGSTDGTAR